MMMQVTTITRFSKSQGKRVLLTTLVLPDYCFSIRSSHFVYTRDKFIVRKGTRDVRLH